MKHELIEFDSHLNMRQKYFTRAFLNGDKCNHKESELLELIPRFRKTLFQQALLKNRALKPAEIIDIVEDFIRIRNLPCWEQYILSSFGGYVADRVLVKKIGMSRQTLERDLESKKLLEDFWGYMLTMCAAKPSSIKKYQYDFQNFLIWKFEGVKINLSDLQLEDFKNFIFLENQRQSNSHIITSFRHISNFLSFSGLTQKNFKHSLPKFKKRFRSPIPKHLPKSDIQNVYGAILEQNAGRRNFAIALLMGQLGLRAQEVVAIKLNDIDWENKQILINGKRDYIDYMPVSNQIVTTLKDYIENDRKGTSDFLFVHLRTPYRKFKNGSICNTILKEAYKHLNMPDMKGRVGSRVLRHSVATRLLENGATLETIAQFLRHRSSTTTQIYARHDIKALRTLSKELPQVIGG